MAVNREDSSEEFKQIAKSFNMLRDAASQR